MINIVEISPPKKISGLSSFLITFDYDQRIVDFLKALPTYYFHKKLLAWEIPIDLITEVLDSLTFIDDIKLDLIPDSVEPSYKKTVLPPLTEEEKHAFKATPYNHQLEAVDFLLKKGNSLLLDGCGVGKSLEMILFAETLKKRGFIDHCLIITGIAGLRSNWEKEIAKFSSETSVIIGRHITKTGQVSYKSIPKRAEQLKNKIDEFFVLLNVESLRDSKIIEAIKKSENNFGLIMFDEIHKCGASATSQGQNLLKLDAPFKVGATGTLAVNTPESCRMPLHWTGNDNATLTVFKSQYCCFGGFGGNQIIGYKNLDLLREEIEACSLRRTLFDVRADIPDLTIDVEYLDMEEDQKIFYEAIKDGVKEEADKIDLKPGNLLALTTRLRQATACPSVLTTQVIESIKVNRAMEYIEEITSQGEKVVVFSMFKEPLKQLAEKLKETNLKFSLNTGDQPDDLISRNVTTFQNDPEELVFLGSFSKMGTGYTLNSSMYLICIDTPYTHSLFEQGYQRVHRISNTRPAFIKVLVCNNTIDERVQDIVASKKELGEYLVDGVDNTLSDSLNKELYKIIKGL